MQTCYECLEKHCARKNLIIWRSDLMYTPDPQTCDFCQARRPAVRGVHLSVLGNTRLARELFRIYEKTSRSPACEEL